MSVQQSDFEITSIAQSGAQSYPQRQVGPLQPSTNDELSAGVASYVAIARPHHWLKNLLLVAGAGLALLHGGESFEQANVIRLSWGVVAFCLLSSSNYVINEILDAPGDRNHPQKWKRPVAARRVSLTVAYTEWGVLGVLGLAMAVPFGVSFLLVACAFLALGFAYNIPPLRLKDRAYIDVACEAVNCPLRVLAGWFIVLPGAVPDTSLVAALWAAGAAAMAGKRLQEYRLIGDKQIAAAYRLSFRHYDVRRLQLSVMAYAAVASILLGVWATAFVAST